jgi:hypothetical protein
VSTCLILLFLECPNINIFSDSQIHGACGGEGAAITLMLLPLKSRSIAAVSPQVNNACCCSEGGRCHQSIQKDHIYRICKLEDQPWKAEPASKDTEKRKTQTSRTTTHNGTTKVVHSRSSQATAPQTAHLRGAHYSNYM